MNSLSSLRNIIFDFGGVILNIDYQRTEDAFKQLGIRDFAGIYSQAEQKQLFDDLETGKIGPAQFRDSIRSLAGPVSDPLIDQAWNAMLLDLPEERIELLESLGKKYRIFLLSNTNAIHYDSFAAYMRNKFKRDIFKDVFEKAYLSFEIGMRKPDKEIFEYVVKQNGLNKEETLFIDDSIQHIHGARAAGLHAHWLEKGTTILDLFGN